MLAWANWCTLNMCSQYKHYFIDCENLLQTEQACAHYPES